MSHTTLIGSTSRLSLRTAVIPSLLNCTASSSSSTSTSASSSRASFHTSSTPLESKRKIVARQKKQKNLALRTERSRQDVQGLVDPILGDLKPEVRTGGFFARQSSGSNVNNNNNAKEEVGGKYERSLLKKVVLDRQSIWFSQPPQYPSQYTVENSSFPAPVQPAVYTGSLSSTSESTSDSTSTSTSNLNLNADQKFLFKHLPETLLSSLPAAQAAKLGKSPTAAERRAYEEAVAMEAKMSEQTMRVLDLRNADAKGVRKESVRRIVEVFGGDLNTNNGNDNGDGEPVATAPRMNTGHPTVTSAILTHRIHLLNTHLAANPRDVHNKKRLRELVHQRAKILSYYKKRVGRRGGEGEGAYLGLLDKLGLDRRGVEGELIVR